MATYITGTSNYPGQYDVVPSNTGTSASVSFVLDQIRDPNTGVISQTGNAVIAKAINQIYTIVQATQSTLGINPQDIFDSVASRMNYLQYSGAGAFVPLSGGQMFGPLSLLGTGSLATLSTNYMKTSGLDWNTLGTSSIHGTDSMYLTSDNGVSISSTGGNTQIASNGFLVNSNVVIINASGDVIATGGSILLQPTGNTVIYSHVLPSTVSTYDLGSTGNVWNNLYVNNIVSTGTDLLSEYVAKTGSTMTGPLQMSGTILYTDQIAPISGSTSLAIQALQPNQAINIGFYDVTIGSSGVVLLNSNPLSGVVIGGTSPLLPDTNGLQDIGSSVKPFGTIYATGLSINIPGVVMITGSHMTGDLIMDSGINIVLQSGSVVPQTSGVGTIGTPALPFSGVYADNVNGKPVGRYVFNEVLAVATGTLGTTRAFSFTYPPVSSATMVFVSGVLITPGSQYAITSNVLTITGSMYTPGTAPVAGLYLY